MEDKTLSIISAVTGAIVGIMAITPLVEEVTKTITPKLEQLASGEQRHGMALLTDGKEHENTEDKKEIEELKKKLAKYEEAADKSKPKPEEDSDFYGNGGC